MMRSTGFVFLGALALAGCGFIQPTVPDTARMTMAQFGTGGLDPDVAATQFAQWAFADSGRTYGRPVEGARAVAAMDYIAGQLYTSPRWAGMSAITKEQLLQGRAEVRQALAVRPGTPSQVVVDRMTAAGNALAAGNRDAALAQLTDPAFTAGPQPTLDRLANLPYLQMANVSTQRAGNQLFDDSREERF